MDVSTSDINNVADGGLGLGLLPDVEGLGDGVRTGVAGALGLDNSDEFAELGSRAEAVHDGLVTDNEELDLIPLSPLGDGVDLLLDLGGLVRAARGLDKDTNDHVNTVLLASTANRLEGVAVSRVGSDDLETSLLELRNVLVNLVGGLAVTVGGFVRGVGDTVVVVATSEGAASGNLLGLGLGLGGSRGLLISGLGVGRGGRLLGGNLVDGSGGLLLGGLVNSGGGLGLGGLVRGLRSLIGRLGSLRSLGGSREANLRVGADVDVAGLSDGHNLLGSSVGARSVAGGDGVDQDGLLGAALGDGSDGVGASGRADEDGGLDDAGDLALVLSLLGVGAGDGRGLLDNGGDTAEGVSSRGNLGGLADADGGGLGHGQGGGGEGVSAGGRAVVLLGSRNRDDRDLDDLGGGGLGLGSLVGRLGGLVRGLGSLIGRLRSLRSLGGDNLLGLGSRRGRVGDDCFSMSAHLTLNST